MLSKALVSAAALALAVSAQTSTTCSPLKQDCPADPAVGKKSIRCDFTKGACDAFEHIAGKEVTYGARGAVSAVDAPMQAPTLQSREAIFFGRLEVVMQAAPGKGVITSIVLLSDDLDEIDLEAVGSDTARIQSNTFSRGDSTRHDLLGYLPVADTTAAAGHTYTVDWTTERIEFAVDGVVQRTLRRADIPDRYPESPMRVKLGAWVAGYEGNAPGTIEWAGGVADFSRGAAEAVFERVTVTDYAGGSAATERDVVEYSYGDRSGSSKSIRIHLADGTTITEDSPSSGGSSVSGNSFSGSSVSGNSVSGNSVSGSTSIETAESSSPVSSAAAAAFTKEVLAMGRAAPGNNSTMITKTTASTQTSGGDSGTATHTATRSSVPSAPPVTAAAAAGLTVGAGLVALAALFAL
ncbi:hypothetical protein MY5147_007024 [Beauveria neobassiana]